MRTRYTFERMYRYRFSLYVERTVRGNASPGQRYVEESLYETIEKYAYSYINKPYMYTFILIFITSL